MWVPREEEGEDRFLGFPISQCDQLDEYTSQRNQDNPPKQNTGYQNINKKS